ncbi:hypothetical protein [Shewanella livingstonensis]|jgi:hypothetical protein|uniref:Uncharacterized protein n=1 Tax=Shewanella livingstonensis TaxID=150120 RepID=A0A3G8LZS2_9GAMM|nr:hypothetical protein [Shewanella livingstonensis]AZG74934.1 hypothetical protein EGC82_20570 [Shewanella livingstonensis]
MIKISDLYYENRKKYDELSVFHWFSKAIGVEYECLSLSERPDFIIKLESKKIGVEITLAERMSSQPFSMQQIESSQRQFSEKLIQNIKPNLPLDVGLIFEDGVAVDNKSADKALMVLIPLINQVSASMAPNSVEYLVRKKVDLLHIKQMKHICPEIPNFLQHIQLLNDGQKVSVVTGCRGGIVDYFNESDLLPILKKKHKALLGYAKCDEHWLVIVSGQVPPIFVEHESPPKLMIASMATSFAGLNLQHPIKSNFERVYFFDCPTNAILIT